jgi:hypothetical protein
VTLAFCWTHWRREFVKIDEGGPAPIVHEALERIAALYAIDNRIRCRYGFNHWHGLVAFLTTAVSKWIPTASTAR